MHFAHFFNENKLYSLICFGCKNLEYIMIALCKKEIFPSTWQKALSYKLGLFIFPRPKMQKRWKNWMNRKKLHKSCIFQSESPNFSSSSNCWMYNVRKTIDFTFKSIKLCRRLNVFSIKISIKKTLKTDDLFPSELPSAYFLLQIEQTVISINLMSKIVLQNFESFAH